MAPGDTWYEANCPRAHCDWSLGSHPCIEEARDAIFVHMLRKHYCTEREAAAWAQMSGPDVIVPWMEQELEEDLEAGDNHGQVKKAIPKWEQDKRDKSEHEAKAPAAASASAAGDSDCNNKRRAAPYTATTEPQTKKLVAAIKEEVNEALNTAIQTVFPRGGSSAPGQVPVHAVAQLWVKATGALSRATTVLQAAAGAGSSAAAAFQEMANIVHSPHSA